MGSGQWHGDSCCFLDGSASIYLSSGGGYLGGGQSGESIRKVAKEMVAGAAECLTQTDPYIYTPCRKRVRLSLTSLTDKGVLSFAAEVELRNNRHPLSKLGGAAQNVITQYRHVAP